MLKIFLKSTFPLHVYWADSHLMSILYFWAEHSLNLGYSRYCDVFLSEMQSLASRKKSFLEDVVIYPR